MLLSDDQLDLLKGDLDFILARTSCNSIQLTKGQVSTALQRDADILLDLVEGMPPSEARWLSVPLDDLQPLIHRRARGSSGGGGGDSGCLLIAGL